MVDARHEPVVVSAVRTAVGKAPRGTLRETRADDLAATVLGAAISGVPGLEAADLDDVIIGCAFPEGSQGMNMARIAALRAGIPYQVPAMTVNRFCASGLQTVALAADRIRTGAAAAIVAGGAESMSLVPMGGERFLPNPELTRIAPGTYLGMGLTAEKIVEQFDVSREDQDRFALSSHEKALAAIESGRFAEEITPVVVTFKNPGKNGKPVVEEIEFAVDEGPRSDTSLESLGRLRAVFKQGGTITAGTASQTSDGAAALVVMSRERAEAIDAKPLAAMRGYAVAGVPPELMGIGPVEAIPKLLAQVGLAQDQIDLFEINEAFAAQALHVVRALGIPAEKVNVNGGAVALGHPLGATGAKLTVTLLHEMRRRGARYGIVSMCVGGGMGAAGLFELVGA
jgi:acetyl-CoA acyltransferase